MERGIPIYYVPSGQKVDHYIKKWKTLENYVKQEDALNLLFRDLCPKNIKMEHVLLKIAVLNNFYSTNIFDVFTVAKHYLEVNIDERLACGDDTLVDDLARVPFKGDKVKFFYSFATKFCSHHQPLNYPIYDNYVSEVLKFFRRRDKFHDFQNADLKCYPSFKRTIDLFMQFYGLEEFNYKQIDQYIWQLGKDYYKRNYKKARQNRESE